MHRFKAHSNESACRKSGRLGMEQVLCDCSENRKFWTGDSRVELHAKNQEDVGLIQTVLFDITPRATIDVRYFSRRSRHESHK